MTNVLNLGAVFILGAMHALEPGHGKTAMASYTLGNKNAKNHLFILVFSMAFSHTFMLLAIGFVVSYLFPFFDSEKAEYILGIISPLILMSIGGYMLYKIKNNKHVCSSSCTHHHHHSSATEKKTINLNSLKLSTVNDNKVTHTHKTTALIGILSGLIPCPSAIAAFFMAGQSGSFANSFGYVLIYVLGFVVVMFLLAILFSIIGKKLTQKQEKFPIFNKMDLISSYLIVIIGLCYLFNNFFYHHH
jgi:ABC-type nickel/cobalt efflux system permease component RcnA